MLSLRINNLPPWDCWQLIPTPCGWCPSKRHPSGGSKTSGHLGRSCIQRSGYTRGFREAIRFNEAKPDFLNACGFPAGDIHTAMECIWMVGDLDPETTQIDLQYINRQSAGKKKEKGAQSIQLAKKTDKSSLLSWSSQSPQKSIDFMLPPSAWASARIRAWDSSCSAADTACKLCSSPDQCKTLRVEKFHPLNAVLWCQSKNKFRLDSDVAWLCKIPNIYCFGALLQGSAFVVTTIELRVFVFVSRVMLPVSQFPPCTKTHPPFARLCSSQNLVWEQLGIQ